MSDDEVTSKMIEAGQVADQAWYEHQSGPLVRSVYLAMREAAGAADVEAEGHSVTGEMVEAGRNAEIEWASSQSGPKVAAVYRAMRAAAAGTT